MKISRRYNFVYLIISRTVKFSINQFHDELCIINAIERPDAVPVWEPDDVLVHDFNDLFTREPASNVNPTQLWLQCFDR